MAKHPYVPVHNVAEVQFLQQLNGQKIENTFYWLFSSTIGGDELLALCNLYIASWNSHVAAHQSSDVQYRGAIATDLTSKDALSIQVVETGNGGGDGSKSLPGGSCLSLKRTTAHRGRSARGRIYFAGIPEAYQTGNAVTTAYGDSVITAINAVSSDITAALSTGEAQEVVVSRFQNGAWLTAGITYPVLSYVLADYNIDSQRRRLTGRGQ